MSKVVRHENESLESLLKRFRRKVNEDGILADLKEKEAYITPSERRREEKNEKKRKIAKIKRREKAYSLYIMNNKMVYPKKWTEQSSEESQGQAPTRGISPRVAPRVQRAPYVSPKK